VGLATLILAAGFFIYRAAFAQSGETHPLHLNTTNPPVLWSCTRCWSLTETPLPFDYA
jgi:hypothetical protein